MRNGSIERNFLQEKLRMVGEALQQLKKDRKIRGFLRTGPFSFAKRRMGVDFYAVYVSDVKYIARSLSVGENININLFDTKTIIQRKILETIKRL